MKKMNEQRLKKLENITSRLVSKFIFEELLDVEKVFGIITITGVKISSDLSYLDVYVSSFKNGDKLPKTLAKHNYVIQKKINKAIDIRKLPKIRFRYDSSGEVGQDVTNTINKYTNNI